MTPVITNRRLAWVKRALSADSNEYCNPKPKIQTARPTYRHYTHARARGRTHACMHARAHTRTHARTHAHVRTQTRVHTHTHTRARARTHARTHTHTHTHTHTQVTSLWFTTSNNIMLTAYAPWTDTSEMTDTKPWSETAPSSPPSPTNRYLHVCQRHSVNNREKLQDTNLMT